MSYKNKPAEVEAIKLSCAVFDSEGKRLADKGEWLIVDREQQFYMKDEDFHKVFIKVKPPVEVKKEVEYKPYPVYVEKIRIEPWCPPRIPWWNKPFVWCDSHSYLKCHP
jgi:hypothetical protein